MQNVSFNTVERFAHTQGKPLIVSYQQATNTLVIINQQFCLSTFEFNAKTNTIEPKCPALEPIEQLQAGTKILLAQFLVDKSQVLIATSKGQVFTLNPETQEVDHKAENQDGILAASLSPTQEFLYIVTKNSTLIQLELEEYDLVSEVPLLDENVEQNKNRKVDVEQPVEFCWRPDGNFFALNIAIENEGRRCQTRDKQLNIYVSPSKSDIEAKGLVQSVCQKSWPTMGHAVSWQPNGSIIAGSDYVSKKQNNNEVNQYRIIFWEKNGLRHLEFELPKQVNKILHIDYSPDSAVLYVDCQTNLENSPRTLYLFYRSNYKWHLKNQLVLQSQAKYITFKTKNNKIVLISISQLILLDYTIELSKSEWLTVQQQKAIIQKHKKTYTVSYCIDGKNLKVSDYSKSLIPPPMSLYSVNVNQTIIGSSLNKHRVLLITLTKYLIYDYLVNKIVSTYERNQNNSFDIHAGIKLVSSDQNEKLQFISNGYYFKQTEKGSGIVKRQQAVDEKDSIFTRIYKVQLENSQKHQGDSNNDKMQEDNLSTPLTEIETHFQNDILKVNSTIISEDCLSYLFYHEFILFTVSTNAMYDRMYIFNLKLDRWIWDDDCEEYQQNIPLQQRLEELEQKQKLNVRNVERGSKIITCTKGRVVFQLPRGNLQGIYPKIIIIDEVEKSMNAKEYCQAFELIRTHKLDFNILVDLSPQRFIQQAQDILKQINRVDYLNLFISQINNDISSEIYYILNKEQVEEVEQYFKVKFQNNKKIENICSIISNQLRKIDQKKYILSIFTSEIKRNRLNEVLFEIKDLKQHDVEKIIPPHLSVKSAAEKQKKTQKTLNSQQILEYICWLVDANYIYDAALLTYDLELAAMTARCTQKDPKEYIPYIESLKALEKQNEIQFRKKVCLDLKKYSQAIKQLALGSEKQKQQAITIVSEQKLYKQGLRTFAQQKEKLYQIKMMMVEELQETNQVNEAYQICKSIPNFEKCLEIAKNDMDSRKVIESLHGLKLSNEEKIQYVKNLLETLKDEAKNKSDLARLYVFIENYEEAVKLYLKGGNYRKFYEYLNNVSSEFVQKEIVPQLKLQTSLRKNLLLKDKNMYVEKLARLQKVHKHKKHQGGQVHKFKNHQNQDMYSEVSMSSKASSYTMSTTTGMRRKKDKKRHILTRNVKEGSILEEEYLLAFLEDIKSRSEENIKDTKLLVQHLIYLNLIDQAEELKNISNEYITFMNQPKAKSFAMLKFQELHPQAAELYFQEKKNTLTFDSFNYLL